MTAGVPELARYRLARARQAMTEGATLLGADAAVGAVNRFYYAAFYAARALLAVKEVDSSKHSGVIALFQQHYVKTGLLAPEIARVLPRTFEKRLNSDYEDFAELSAADARAVHVEVESFVAACERLLAALLAAPPC